MYYVCVCVTYVCGVSVFRYVHVCDICVNVCVKRRDYSPHLDHSSCKEGVDTPGQHGAGNVPIDVERLMRTNLRHCNLGRGGGVNGKYGENNKKQNTHR